MSVNRDQSVLLGYQREWVADASPVKVIEKSRRIGLSYAEAADDVLYAASSEGANVYYISYNKEMTQGFIQDCAGWAKAYQMAASQIDESVIEVDERQVLTYTIKFDSGHQIQAFTSNPRNLRSKGRPGERLVIDEAAFVDDIQELLKAAMAMTIWGGQIRIISTHNGEDNPFNELINDIRAGRFDYSLHRVDFDEALADGLYQRICQVTGQAWSRNGEAQWRQQMINRYKPNQDEELFCIPAQGGGSYLTRVMIEACMAPAPVLRFDGTKAYNALPEPARAAEMEDWIREHLKPLLARLNPQRRHALGQDFARSGDLSVIAPLEIGETLHRSVPFLMEMHNVPFKQQEQVLFAIGNNLPRLSGVAIDSRGNGAYIGETAQDEWGSIVDQVQATENWYRERMPRYKARFEDGTITLPQNDDLVEDHRAFKLVRGVARLPEGKTSGQRHGDGAMACVLADHAADLDGTEIDFIRVPKNGPANDDPDDMDDDISVWGSGAW